MMKKLIIIMLGLFLISGKPVITKTRSGVVKDNLTKELLVGVRIKNLVTQEIVYSDFDGKFEISSTPTDSLEFELISYKKNVSITGNSTYLLTN